jgi:hypothetical protein
MVERYAPYQHDCGVGIESIATIVDGVPLDSGAIDFGLR